MLTLFLVMGFSGLSARLLFVQIFQHDEWEALAEKDYTRKTIEPAERGVIFDCDGEQLVHNRPVRTVIADWYQLSDYRVLIRGVAASRGVSVDEVTVEYGVRKPDLDKLFDDYMDYIAAVAAPELEMPFDEVRGLLKFGERKEVVIASGLSKADADRLEARFSGAGIRGVRLRDGVERFYPGGQIMAHVLGFVDRDQVGREGIERTFDNVLAGEEGYRYIQVDRRGREISAYRGEEKPAKRGANIHLTVDGDIQVIVEQELRAAMEEFRADGMMAVLVDPFTGDILALANTPAFDPNTREGERKNCLITDVFEPGSTFKIIAAAAALDTHKVSPRTVINCSHGYFQEGKLSIRDHHPYGDLTVGGVLQKSSNIGAFFLARMAGMKTYYDYISKFGFGRRTGIELSAEARGVVRMNGNLIDFSRLSYGYAVNTTPLQVAMAYSAVANGGNLMRPRLLTKVVKDDGTVLRQTKPQILERAVSSRTAAQLRTMLESVVSEKGTAKLAAIPGYHAAGKTGTTKKLNMQTGRYYDSRYVTSFAGFAPAADPELVCVVVADNPRPRDDIPAYGGTVAAPVFSRIMRRVLAHRDVAPTLPVEEEEKGELVSAQ